jgi:large subunit ribosomal protein L5
VTDETMVDQTTDGQATDGQTAESQAVDEQASAANQTDATADAGEQTADPQPAAEQAPDTADASVSAAGDASADAANAATADVSQATEPPAEEAAAPRRSSSRSKKAEAAEVDSAPSNAGGVISGLRARYNDEVIAALTKEFGYSNPNQVPRVSKIVVNIGLGEALANAKALDAAVGDLAQITGQKPIVTRARRSIAQFRLRTGNPIGAKVTLRGQRMWDFLERLTRLALPRIRDFRGVPTKSFDGRGNYSLGLREQLAFPEIDYDKIDRLRGLEVSIVTTAKTDEESKRLLQLLGMPFAGQNG